MTKTNHFSLFDGPVFDGPFVKEKFDELMHVGVFDKEADIFFRFDPSEISNIHGNLYESLKLRDLDVYAFLEGKETLLKLVNVFINWLYNIRYDKLSREEFIDTVSKFITEIYKIHPFVYGNSKTIAIFIKRFIELQGFEINVDEFITGINVFREGLQVAASNFKGIEDNKYDELRNFFNSVLSNERTYGSNHNNRRK